MLKDRTTRAETISLTILSFFGTLSAYFLGDFIILANILGICLSIATVALVVFFASLQLKKLVDTYLKKSEIIPFEIKFGLLNAAITIPSVASAIFMYVLSIFENKAGYVVGSYLSSIFVSLVFLTFAYWIFLYRRKAQRGGDNA